MSNPIFNGKSHAEATAGGTVWTLSRRLRGWRWARGDDSRLPKQGTPNGWSERWTKSQAKRGWVTADRPSPCRPAPAAFSWLIRRTSGLSGHPFLGCAPLGGQRAGSLVHADCVRGLHDRLQIRDQLDWKNGLGAIADADDGRHLGDSSLCVESGALALQGERRVGRASGVRPIPDDLDPNGTSARPAPPRARASCAPQALGERDRYLSASSLSRPLGRVRSRRLRLPLDAPIGAQQHSSVSLRGFAADRVRASLLSHADLLMPGPRQR